MPPLHLITDDSILRDPGFAGVAEEVLRAGGAEVAVHLRAEGLPARALFALAVRLVPVAEEAGGRLLVNDRVDVACGSAAHGVQLGKRGFPRPEARRLLGPGPLLGASVHSVAEARAAADEGADFLLAGTLFATASHPGRESSGTHWLRDLEGLRLPVIGIGGISPERVAEVLAAGGAGVAVLRGVWRAERPIERLHDFLAALREGFSR